jgi:hypothetical protein
MLTMNKSLALGHRLAFIPWPNANDDQTYGFSNSNDDLTPTMSTHKRNYDLTLTMS